MLTQPRPEEVRQLVLNAFRSHLGSAESWDLNEHLLVRDGRLYGRSYRLGGLMAMWMSDVHLLQVYAADGQMLQTFDLSHGCDSRRMAA